MKFFKKNLPGFIVGVLSTAIVVVLATSVLAAYTDVSFSTVNIELNGEKIASSRDNYILEDGKTQVPYSLTYTNENGGGTTYLPVRKLSEMLGIGIEWNADTNSVSITTHDRTDTVTPSAPPRTNAPATPAPTPLPNIAGASISGEQAKEIALKHAGINKDAALFVKVEAEHKPNRIIYDIEFYADNKEYDYEIDGNTGEILSFDYEIENGRYPSNSPNNSQKYISEADAKAIALEKAGLDASQITYKKCKFEFDDGLAIFDIEIISNGKEYEFEINAVTGDILSYDVDSSWH